MHATHTGEICFKTSAQAAAGTGGCGTWCQNGPPRECKDNDKCLANKDGWSDLSTCQAHAATYCSDANWQKDDFSAAHSALPPTVHLPCIGALLTYC